MSNQTQPKGTFKIEVDSGTDTAKKWVTMRPKDIQIIESIHVKMSDEAIQRVYCYGAAHAYTINIPLEDLYQLMNSVEEE